MTSFLKTTAAFLAAGTVINIAAFATMKWWLPTMYKAVGLDYQEIISCYSPSED